MSNFTYKIDNVTPPEAADYAIRYSNEGGDNKLRRGKEEYAKTKGGEEFKTDLGENNTGYDVFLGGREVSKEEYEKF